MSIKYASAVGAVRAMEFSLLSQSELESILSINNISEISDMIISRCTADNSEPDTDILKLLENELCRTWDFINANECKELEILLYKNNYQNFKAALKALIMNENAERFFIRPTTLELNRLTEIIASKNYGELPEYMQKAAETAYDIITSKLDGQMAEAVLDSSCLNEMTNSSRQFKSGFMLEYSLKLAELSDIKTAYRCSIMGMPDSFMKIALSGENELLNKESLIRASAAGKESCLAFLESSGFSKAAEILRKSSAEFEKWCRNELADIVEKAKYEAFGTAPIEAYYLAKENEIKNLRIIYLCKKCGVSNELIMERICRPYV